MIKEIIKVLIYCTIAILVASLFHYIAVINK